MAYDDVKEFEGETYSGMAVGGEHTWLYPNGLWHETKVAPDKWEFTFASLKERERSAPAGSGVPVGTEYHWYILAHQRVRKIDADSYTTFMSGLKYKVAHKRPHWRKWSSEYPEQPSEREKLTAILEETLEGARSPLRSGAATRRSEPKPVVVWGTENFLRGRCAPARLAGIWRLPSESSGTRIPTTYGAGAASR